MQAVETPDLPEAKMGGAGDSGDAEKQGAALLAAHEKNTDSLASVRTDIPSEEKGAEVKLAQDYYQLEFFPNSKNAPEVAKNLNLIYLHVVNNGEVKTITISQEELGKNPSLKVDGYIASILVLGTGPMSASLDGEKLGAIHKFDDQSFQVEGNSKIIYPKDIATPEHSAEELQGFIFKTGQPELAGCYFIGSIAFSDLYLGEAINNAQKMTLTLQMGNGIYSLPIEQRQRLEYKKMGDVIFQYQGNNPDRLRDIENIDLKLKAIYDGINAVEEMFNAGLVDEVNIVDIEKDNAMASSEENKISFTIARMRGSPESLKETTEHEILHKVVHAAGFTDSEAMRRLFADIKGYSGERKNELIQLGEIPFEQFTPDPKNLIFFNFINEAHFITEEGGGHSHANIWEFMTSFTHSLMYVA